MLKKLTDIIYSFPCQLTVLQVRSNMLLLAIWALLALIINGSIGTKLGLKYLFLSPEYLGKVGFWSFFIVGLAYGTLVMSWNLATYLLSAYRFSFLASLSRPFTKFTLNNLVVPISFAIFYLYLLIEFGTQHELMPVSVVLFHCIGFVFGFISFIGLLALYFNFTNKDIFSLLKGTNPISYEGTISPNRPDQPLIEDIKLNRYQWRVDTYLTETFRPRLVRSVAHYDEKLLIRVFRQNHFNVLFVQLLTILLLLLLGAFMEKPILRIPTGASIFLLSSVLVAIAGAFSYWFLKWRVTAIIVLLFIINQLTRYDIFHHRNKAYGMDYHSEFPEYSVKSLNVICDSQTVGFDKEATIEILERWKAKNSRNGEKPKMVFFCVSGGGLKSGAWAVKILQQADSVTDNRFFDHTALITGASGGIMGTSYYRELNLRKKQGQQVNLFDEIHINNVSKDLLNPISFTIVTNDLFLPWATFESGGFTYKKDRGYIFEKALNENTNNLLNKTIGEYHKPERDAIIPLLFVTPSIVNDGRRLIISPQPISYMMVEPVGVSRPNTVTVDAVDFGRLFARQGAQNLQFTTALRMNATYPYVLPNVYLPSSPQIEVLDAGFRDNFGIKPATRFIQVFRDWIQDNTSGVVMVVVRAYERESEIESSEDRGVFETIFNPLGIAFKIMSLQDYEHDSSLAYLYDSLGKDFFEVIRFTYVPTSGMEDSPISFYVTERERKDVIEAVKSPEIQANLQRLKIILNK